MHGTKALEEIRRKSASVPVIVVTGETLAESRDACTRLGVQEYLAKPPDYRALLQAFTRALAHPATDEQFMVVTMRLPARVHKTLAEVDPNVERAITRICDECSEQVRTLIAKN